MPLHLSDNAKWHTAFDRSGKPLHAVFHSTITQLLPFPLLLFKGQQ